MAKYMNGWRCIFEVPPPNGSRVLVTNNPAAKLRDGSMSHLWIGYPIKSGDEWVSFDDADRKIRGIVAWRSLPGDAL